MSFLFSNVGVMVIVQYTFTCIYLVDAFFLKRLTN